jgi:hypothetical protein
MILKVGVAFAGARIVLWAAAGGFCEQHRNSEKRATAAPLYCGYPINQQSL